MDNHNPSPRLLTLQEDQGHYFYTGTANDKQVLLGLLYPSMIAVFFDLEGNWVDLQERQLSNEALAAGSGGVFDACFSHHFQHDIDSWKYELGLQPAEIVIKEFFIEEFRIGIERPHKYWSRALNNIDDDPQSDPREIYEIIERWEQSGQFVLWWNNDYYVDKDGRIVAT